MLYEEEEGSQKADEVNTIIISSGNLKQTRPTPSAGTRAAKAVMFCTYNNYSHPGCISTTVGLVLIVSIYLLNAKCKFL